MHRCAASCPSKIKKKVLSLVYAFLSITLRILFLKTAEILTRNCVANLGLIEMNLILNLGCKIVFEKSLEYLSNFQSLLIPLKLPVSGCNLEKVHNFIG